MNKHRSEKAYSPNWFGVDFARAALSGGIMILGVAALERTAVAQAKPPELIDIVPNSGPAGPAYPVEATIRGTGFMPTGNMLQFGLVTLTLPSPDGEHITFYVPKLVPSRTEVPPIVLPPREYRVTVSTSSGKSNALTFTLTRGPGGE